MKPIVLSDVSLHFRVKRQGGENLKDYLLSGLFRRRKRNVMEVKALEHLDLEIDDGERLGIIGQ